MRILPQNWSTDTVCRSTISCARPDRSGERAGSTGRRPRRMTAPWSAGALVVTLVAGVSCAPDPAQRRAERTVDAEYDVETGRLELITFDSDDNGTIDTWSYMEGNTVLHTEMDHDEDGTVDRWEYYRADRTLEKVGFSRSGGGVVDAWAFEGVDGEVARIEVSTLADGAVDRWEFYEAGALVRVEEDVDLDGRPDKWETREGGRSAGASAGVRIGCPRGDRESAR